MDAYRCILVYIHRPRRTTCGVLTHRGTRAAARTVQHISDGMPMLEAVKAFRPTCLLGLSTQKDVFTEDIVRATAAVRNRRI